MSRRVANTICAVVILLVIAWCVYPIYPSTMSLCAMLDETYRSTPPTEWQMKAHRGAIVRIDGLMSRWGSSEYFGINFPCSTGMMSSAVELPRSVLMSQETRRRIDRTTSTDAMITELPVNAWVRVKQLGPGGCFSSGVVVTALAINSKGEPRPAELPVR